MRKLHVLLVSLGSLMSSVAMAAATEAPATTDITGTITNFVTGWVVPIGTALVVLGIIRYLIRSW